MLGAALGVAAGGAAWLGAADGAADGSSTGIEGEGEAVVLQATKPNERAAASPAVATIRLIMETNYLRVRAHERGLDAACTEYQWRRLSCHDLSVIIRQSPATPIPIPAVSFADTMSADRAA